MYILYYSRSFCVLFSLHLGREPSQSGSLALGESLLDTRRLVRGCADGVVLRSVLATIAVDRGGGRSRGQSLWEKLRSGPQLFFFLIFTYLFIWLCQVLAAVCEVF